MRAAVSQGRHRRKDDILKMAGSQTRLLVKQPMNTVQYSSKADDINSSYIWHRLGVFIKWTPFNKAVVLCFGLPPSLQQSLQDLSQINLEDPFSFYTIFLEKVLALYDAAIWSWRDLVRELEKVDSSVSTLMLRLLTSSARIDPRPTIQNQIIRKCTKLLDT